MKLSELILFAAQEIRVHGDCDVVVRNAGTYAAVIGGPGGFGSVNLAGTGVDRVAIINIGMPTACNLWDDVARVVKDG